MPKLFLDFLSKRGFKCLERHLIFASSKYHIDLFLVLSLLCVRFCWWKQGCAYRRIALSVVRRLWSGCKNGSELEEHPFPWAQAVEQHWTSWKHCLVWCERRKGVEWEKKRGRVSKPFLCCYFGHSSFLSHTKAAIANLMFPSVPHYFFLFPLLCLLACWEMLVPGFVQFSANLWDLMQCVMHVAQGSQAEITAPQHSK